MRGYVAASALGLAMVVGGMLPPAHASHAHRIHVVRHVAPAHWWRPDGYFVYGPTSWSFRYYDHYWAGAGPFPYARKPWPLGCTPPLLCR